MDKRLSKVERDVDLHDYNDDDMVVNDTPPNSPCDNPPPPPSTNLPPPPPPLSHPPPRAPSPPPDSYPESDPAKKGENNERDVDTKTDQPIPNTREISQEQAFLLKGAHDVEAGSSSATASDPSTPPPKKKNKLIFSLNELAETWRLPTEEVKEIMSEYNVTSRQKKVARKEECISIKLSQAPAFDDKSANVQRTDN
ncbi:uncharacterized protein LOC111885818 [Lactuca sativa]|uniref:uncharacterized protein LOC111885818 n=1 Tax=Lactuca sativa TaxID=4236 RepID=UPI000CD89C61|nr:uncharacterized protein LOC111885818 [Lactuca sativa]